MSAVAKYIKGLLERGQHHFTTEDAVQALGGDRKPIARALKRLISKGELASPQRSFYVVVPPEYKILGCLPADQFIPHLMENVGEPYHVGLLSAAQLHGAAHHRPQRFQVIVGRPRSSIECGKVCVDFHVRKDLELVATVYMNTPRGPVRVSSPEANRLVLGSATSENRYSTPGSSCLTVPLSSVCEPCVTSNGMLLPVGIVEQVVYCTWEQAPVWALKEQIFNTKKVRSLSHPSSSASLASRAAKTAMRKSAPDPFFVTLYTQASAPF